MPEHAQKTVHKLKEVVVTIQDQPLPSHTNLPHLEVETLTISSETKLELPLTLPQVMKEMTL